MPGCQRTGRKYTIDEILGQIVAKLPQDPKHPGKPIRRLTQMLDGDKVGVSSLRLRMFRKKRCCVCPLWY